MAKKPFTIPADYPFKDDLIKFQQMHTHTAKRIRTATIGDTTVTLEEKVVYANAPTTLYTKVFKHTAKIMELSFAASTLVLRVCCLMDQHQYSIKLTADIVDMDAKTFAKAMLELTHANFVRKVQGQRSMYWVNLIMVANGDARSAEIDPPE